MTVKPPRRKVVVSFSKPDNGVAQLYLKGHAAQRRGDFEAAEAACRQVLATQPAHCKALDLLGTLEAQRGRPAEAEALFARALAIQPDNPYIHNNHANVLCALRRYEEAKQGYARAIALKPDYPDAHANLGNALLEQGLPLEALAHLDLAVALKAGFLKAQFKRGLALMALQREADALVAFESVLKIRPDYAGAHANRGAVLYELRRHDEALAALDHAIALDATLAESLLLRGNVMQDLNRHEDALRDYVRARTLRQGFAMAEWNESLSRLLLGDFTQGWLLFESRWRNGQNVGDLHLMQPLWDGRKVDGRLLVWGEQGIGDQIHQLGMVDGLAGRAGEVVIAVHERLLPLAARSLPGMRVIGLEAAQHEACEMQTPLGSLGRHLRRSWADFPVERTAYLQADPARVAALAKSLPGKARLTVGLSWHSIAPKVGRAKSMALRDLAPLFGLDGVRFVDLQYGDTAAERGKVRDELGVEVMHVDQVDNRGDLDGLAALIGACDVVVTISNTTAHLAGALGKPTLLMLPFGCARHWYWHEARDDSPWYPSLRLYRQHAAGDWSAVFTGVRAALQKLMRQRGA